jgi:hypothetical protein
MERGLASLKAATYAQDNIDRINAYIHASIRIRTYYPSVWAGEETIDALGRAATVIY